MRSPAVRSAVRSAIRLLALLVIFAAPLRLSAQPAGGVEQVIGLLDQLAAQVAASEAEPFVEGSEGAAQARLAELAAALQAQEARLAERQGQVDASVAAITAALPAFPPTPQPDPDPAPDPAPAPEPPVAGGGAGARDLAAGAVTGPEAATDPAPAPETGSALAASPDAAPSGGESAPPTDPARASLASLPALAELTAPLAFAERARRVLSRPGAEIMDADGRASQLPAFSVLYVYAEAGDPSAPMLAVGRSTRGAEGWVEASRTEDWRTMLVMSYAPNTGRDRTVFFASEDDVLDILDLEEGSAGEMQAVYRQIEDGSYDPSRIVAIEPALAVDSTERPYLMPVLDFVRTSTETHGDVTILQLAALTRDSTRSDPATSRPVGQDRISVEADARAFRVGVAFVIDNTQSMGPYIDRTRSFVRDIASGLADRGLQDRFDFALVGFRDNTGVAENVGYLRRIYRDFGTPAESRTLFATVDEMRPAAASTQNWREDAFAGIDLAISDLNWGEVDTRLVFLITDASPRSVGDMLAANSRMGPETINALAAQRNITLFVLHMQTEQAASVSQRTEGYDDTQRGQQLYSRLSQTGDSAISKYFSVRGETERAFSDSLQLVAGLVIDQLSQLSEDGRLAQPSDVLDDPFLAAISAGGPVVIEDDGDAPLVAAAVAGELYRYQTEYLGSRSGVEAPDFYRGWAADRDIANPERRSLNVSVFVTREQLSDLARRLGDIVTRLREKELGINDFRLSVQAEAGATAVDPEFGSFLPSYLDDLPYGSRFINMTPSIWDSLDPTSRAQLLEEVEAKLASYMAIYSTEEGWITLDDRAPEEQVYPLPLRDLP